MVGCHRWGLTSQYVSATTGFQRHCALDGWSMGWKCKFRVVLGLFYGRTVRSLTASLYDEWHCSTRDRPRPCEEELEFPPLHSSAPRPRSSSHAYSMDTHVNIADNNAACSHRTLESCNFWPREHISPLSRSKKLLYAFEWTAFQNLRRLHKRPWCSAMGLVTKYGVVWAWTRRRCSASRHHLR